MSQHIPIPFWILAAAGLSVVLQARLWRKRARRRSLTVQRAPPMLDALVLARKSGGPAGPYRALAFDGAPSDVLGPADTGSWILAAFEGARSVGMRPLATKDLVNIGRDPGASLVLDHADIARVHAVIERTPEGTYVIDMGSEPHTLVNRVPINKSRLMPGDWIDIGPFSIAVLPNLPEAIRNASKQAVERRTSTAASPSEATTPAVQGPLPAASPSSATRPCPGCSSTKFEARDHAVPLADGGDLTALVCQGCGRVELFLKR